MMKSSSQITLWWKCDETFSYRRTFIIAGEIYTSEKRGSDETGDGSDKNPFKTVLQAMRHAGKEPFPAIFVDAKDEKS